MTPRARVANCFPPVTTFVRPGSGYPKRLQDAGFEKPIHVRGTLPDGPAVAIVGARAASCVSMDRAHAVARHCAERGIAVISGGAIGIDGAAHRGALAGDGATTVVLGSGIDVAYPARHAPLFEIIVERGGALVSMLPPGTAPRTHSFLSRNPLIAALADITIVIEADVKSGSLSTAAAAKKLGRLVAAWPGSRGCDFLLARGSAVIETPEDALAALAGTPRYPAPRVRVLEPFEQQVADAIALGHTSIDAVVVHTGLPVRMVLRAFARNS